MSERDLRGPMLAWVCAMGFVIILVSASPFGQHIIATGLTWNDVPFLVLVVAPFVYLIHWTFSRGTQ